MSDLRRYLRRERTTVTATQLDLDTDGLTYRKWGGLQTAAPGDWLVNRGDEAYTVEREVFARTYRMISPGVYEKMSPVWARQAASGGAIATKEGETRYAAGDMLVFNDPDEEDGYAMSAETFRELYERAE